MIYFLMGFSQHVLSIRLAMGYNTLYVKPRCLLKHWTNCKARSTNLHNAWVQNACWFPVPGLKEISTFTPSWQVSSTVTDQIKIASFQHPDKF